VVDSTEVVVSSVVEVVSVELSVSPVEEELEDSEESSEVVVTSVVEVVSGEELSDDSFSQPEHCHV